MPNLLKPHENEVCDLLLNIKSIKDAYNDSSKRLVSVYGKVSNAYKYKGDKTLEDIEKRDIMHTSTRILNATEKELRATLRVVKYVEKSKVQSAEAINELNNLCVSFGNYSLDFYEKFFFIMLGRSIQENKGHLAHIK